MSQHKYKKGDFVCYGKDCRIKAEVLSVSKHGSLTIRSLHYCDDNWQMIPGSALGYKYKDIAPDRVQPFPVQP